MTQSALDGREKVHSSGKIIVLDQVNEVLNL